MNANAVPWVLKVGGAELVPGAALAAFSLRVAEALRAGRPVIVVHGGGDEVTARADALGLATERRAGQRVTSEPMLEVVAEVLAGRINTRLVHALEGAGVPSVGLTGVSGGLLRVVPAGNPPGSLGWVGSPTSVRTHLLTRLLSDGWTPVLAPLGSDGLGGVFNVNADLAAAAVAGALGADLALLTDVPAVLGADGQPIGRLTMAAAGQLIAAGTARDGMVPKLEGALAALRGGAPSVWVGDLDGLGADGPRPGSGTRLVPTHERPRLAVARRRLPSPEIH
jgi:acetylglutamate kinase